MFAGHRPAGRPQIPYTALEKGVSHIYPAAQLSIIKNKFQSFFILFSENIIKALSYEKVIQIYATKNYRKK